MRNRRFNKGGSSEGGNRGGREGSRGRGDNRGGRGRGENRDGNRGQGGRGDGRRPARGGWARGRNDRGGQGGHRGNNDGKPIDDFWSRLLPDGEDHDFLEKTPCPSCGNLPARIQGRLGPTLLRKCRACALRYVSPRLSTATRQEIMRREPSPISSERNLQLRHQMAALMERMHREMPTLQGMNQRSATLLEIGCRWGHFLQLCRPHYASVEGLEWSKERAAFAQERFDLQVSATDIFRDPWEGRYNIVCAWDLIEREPHPLEFLRWVYEHLESGGLIALSTPNYNSLVRRIVRKRWYGFEPSRHLCYFTPATLTALLEKAGFTDVRIRTSGLAPLREWFGIYNRSDRREPAREQWLESLRSREAAEKARKDRQSGIFRESAWQKAKKAVATFISNVITAPGLGDQMRVYARKK